MGGGGGKDGAVRACAHEREREGEREKKAEESIAS